jgi:hypothetical protein
VARETAKIATPVTSSESITDQNTPRISLPVVEGSSS